MKRIDEIDNYLSTFSTVDNSTAYSDYMDKIVNQRSNCLCSVEPGAIVKLGHLEFIVLEHYPDNSTSVLLKNFAQKMEFGDSGDYLKSNVIRYCNNYFYAELSEAVGATNIIKHTINLTADDGTGELYCEEYVSILTTELYRKYRKYIPAYGDAWWTATRVNVDMNDYSRYVCCVGSVGILGWDDCGCRDGVRPFCILNSSVLIS